MRLFRTSVDLRDVVSVWNEVHRPTLTAEDWLVTANVMAVDVNGVVWNADASQLVITTVDFKNVEAMPTVIGSFRVHEAITNWSKSHVPQKFMSAGNEFELTVDGLLLRDGEPIVKVITGHGIETARMVCLRKVGTIVNCYSFTYEIPVLEVNPSTPEDHEKNMDFFRRTITQVMESSHNGKTAFEMALGYRSWIRVYTKHFGLRDLEMTDGELTKLAKMAILMEDMESYRLTVMRYKKIYELKKDQSLECIGRTQSDLNSMSNEHA